MRPKVCGKSVQKIRIHNRRLTEPWLAARRRQHNPKGDDTLEQRIFPLTQKEVILYHSAEKRDVFSNPFPPGYAYGEGEPPNTRPDAPEVEVGKVSSEKQSLTPLTKG